MEGLVHLDVNGSALSTVPQLKFNEASPFCSTGSVRCYWLSVLSSTASFPDNDQHFTPIGVSLNTALQKKKTPHTKTPLSFSLPPCSLGFFFATNSGPKSSICSKGLYRQCQISMCHSQSIAIYIGING